MSRDNKTLNVNILGVIKLIRKDKKWMMLTFIIASILGVIIAFTTPKSYKSSVMLAPEETSSGFSGSISSIASMVGMNMNIGQSGDAIYPEIYPDLLASKDFLANLFNVKIKTKDGNLTCDYYTYLTKYTKIALIDYPLVGIAKLSELFKSQNKDVRGNKQNNQSSPLWLTPTQEKVIKALSSCINCLVDKKTNVITISVEDQDPLVAALMADTVKAHLQIAITEYKTKKAKNDLEYMEKLYKEARQQYDKARMLYASYADNNQDVILQSYKMKETDLENDMQLKYNIYTQVVEQMQLAKAKVQEHTPSFTVVQSAFVPIQPSGKSRIFTILTYIILGFIIRIVILCWKNKDIFINV